MTMVNTISFEIADFTNGTAEQFLIANTPENVEKVLGHRFTRDIKFAKTFDFQFEKEESVPFDFINPLIWTVMVQTPEFQAELSVETGETEEIAPENPEIIEEITPVAEKNVPKKNYYAVYECFGGAKKKVRTVTSQKMARSSVSELRSMNPSRKYRWEKI